MEVTTPSSGTAWLEKFSHSPMRLFFGYSLWIGLIPPVSAFFGMRRHGWPLAVDTPLHLSSEVAFAISLFYALALIIGFLSTVAVLRWMASTYADRADLRGCFAVVSVSGTPIMLGGVAHLYPNILFHVIVLAPVFALSAYLLFLAIPPLLRTDPERGALMGCAVLGYLVTAFLTLLGLSAILWVHGIGPVIGV